MARILLIEDEREIRANLRRFLALEGHEVLEADNGPAGLALAREADLVLCDVLMPGGMDGFDVLGHLRADAATARLPFVFITASAEQEVRARATDSGADGYVIKPFDLRAIGETVAEILLRSRRPP